MRKFTSMAASLFLVFAGSSTASTTFDLAADWSNISNPNGTWSYNEGATPLPLVSNFTFGGTSPIPPQPAWAPSDTGGNFLPAWFKAQATANGFDWMQGDVVVHTTDPFNSASTSLANVTWTSPMSGTANVSGNLWNVRNIGRSNEWQLLDNNVVLASGLLASGDGHNRSNPETFSFSSLGITAGDVLELVLFRDSAAGDLQGVNFTIDMTSAVPEPQAYALLLAGLVVVGYAARRRMA